MLNRMSAIALSLLVAGAAALNPIRPAATYSPRPGRAKSKDRSYRVPGNKLASKAREGKLGLIR
jgi:hypothetical protein